MLPRAELVFATFNHDHSVAAGNHAAAAAATAGAAEGTKVRSLAVHPVRPWIAMGDEHDVVAVWDFERRALVSRFTTQELREQQLEREAIQQALASDASVEAAIAALEEAQLNEKYHGGSSDSSDLTRAARQRRVAWAVQEAAAWHRAQRQWQQQDGKQPAPGPPTSQGKFGAIEALAFVDAAAVAPQLRGPPTDGDGAADKWHLAVLLEHRVILVDVVGWDRHILPFQLQKQTPTAVVALSARFLALGCGDGQIRMWDTWRWELAGQACPAHSKEVCLLQALLPSSTLLVQHLRVLSLGLEGTALLWHAPVVQVGSGGNGGVDIDPRGLRPVMRLEGSIPLSPHRPAVPEFVHDEEHDMLSVMDVNRIVSVWYLSSSSPSSSTTAGPPPSTPTGSSIGRNTPSPSSFLSSVSSPRLFPGRSGRTTPRLSASGRETPPEHFSSISLASPVSSPKARPMSQQQQQQLPQAPPVSIDRLPILARRSRYKLPPPSLHQKEPVVGVTGAFSFPWRSGGGGGSVLQGVSKTGVLHLMGSAVSCTSSSDPAALIQRQDSTNSLASAASSAIDMSSVKRESSAESASKGASASAILPLATLEEFDLKPFLALAPFSSSALAGSDVAGVGGEIERGGSGPAGGAAASEEDITTMTQFLSHLKVTAILQHPMRRHTYVLGSTIGAFVFLLRRHPPAIAAVPVPAWGRGHLVAYEATLGDGSAGGRLIKARVHLLEAPESSTATGLRSGSDRSLTGVLHPDSLIVGDLRPLTSGPGVPQAYMASLGGSTPQATRARQQAVGKRPDLLLSRSGCFAALLWGFPLHYFMVVNLHASAEAGSGSRILDRGPAAAFAWFRGEEGGNDCYAVLVPGQEARASAEQDVERRKLGGGLFKWRDKPDGRHDGAAAVYVSPELVFKALVLPPPPQSASASSSSTEAGRPTSAASSAAPSSVRVAPLTIEAPGGFFPPNPIQILGGGHPDFLLLGWSHLENAPPALETREQLQRTSYQFIRLAPAAAEDRAGTEATPVLQASKVGPVLPPVARIAFDNSPSSITCPLVALSYLGHGTHLYRIVATSQQQTHRPASITKSGAAPKGAKDTVGQQHLQHGSHALSLVGSLTITARSGGAEPPVSLLWAYGTLFYATQTSVHAVILAASSLGSTNTSTISSGSSTNTHPTFIASEYGEAAAPRFLDVIIASHAAVVSAFGSRSLMIKGALASGPGDEVDALCPVWRDPDDDAGVGGHPYRYLHDAFLPSPAPLPPGPVQLMGLHEGALLTRTALGRLYLLPLDHPTLRMGMLLGAGHVQRAIKWAHGLDPRHHDAVALQLFEPHGPAAADAAVQGLAGLSLAVAADLCIRHALVATLEALLFPLSEGNSATAGDDAAVALLEEVDHLEATDPMGLSSVAKGPAEEAILHGGGSLLFAPPTLRRVALVLSSHKREATLRRLREACRRTGRAEAAGVVALLLGSGRAGGGS